VAPFFRPGVCGILPVRIGNINALSAAGTPLVAPVPVT
jgi:hypothetical protein